jgi:tetratricopeptide (TPR) repeat protein
MDRRILVVVALIGLAGCAAQPQQGTAQTEQVDVVSAVDTQPRSRAIYNVLVGEVAGQRGDKARAAEAYAAAARDTESAAVAERAARIAVYAGREDLAREAAARWQTLAPESSSPRRLRALLALRQGDSQAAYRHLKATLPDEAEAFEESLAEVGAFVANEAANETGVEVIRRLAEDYPDQRMAHYVVARVAMQAGQPETALGAADRALDQSEGWRAARLIRVRALLASERIDEAIDGLHALVDANPENYDLRLQLARTLADQGREASALEQFERLIEARPEDGRGLYAGALLALDRGDADRARRWLERLLATDQRTDAAHYYLGRLAEQNQDYQAARDRYSRTGGSYEHQAQVRLALIEGAEGDIASAVERLQRLRKNNPNMALQAWQAQGQLLREAGRLEAAIEAYNKGLESDSGNTDLLYSRAMTHVSGGNIEAALRDLRTVLEDEPDNAHALNALGYTLADNTDRYAEAEELIRRAYAQRPEDPAVIDSMGWVAYKQGRLEEAERYLRQAYEMSDQAEIAAHLGEVLWQRGKREEARQVWNKALAAHEDTEVVRETMERLTP